MEKYWRKLRQIFGGKGRPPKETMLILFLSGILIFVILLPTEKKGAGSQSRKNQGDGSVTVDGNTADFQMTEIKGAETALDEYKHGLEKELEDFLSGVSGVGEADVLIYMKDSQEYIVEKDNPMSSSTSGESSESSKDETTVYTVNGNGDEVPFVSQTRSPAIDGVLVAAKGASNETVRLQIVRLVMALYGIDANKVEVVAVQ